MSNFKKLSKNVQQLTIASPQKSGVINWLNVNDAGKAEIEYLRKRFNFKLPHLSASSAKVASPRPALIHEDDYVFLIMHFPLPPSDQSGRIAAAEVDFFIGHGFLVTLPRGPLAPLNDFFNSCKKDDSGLLCRELGSSAILLYEILNKLLDFSYRILDENSLAIGRAERIILSGEPKKSADLILNLRHNLINMRKIMQNHKNLIKRLMAMESSLIPPEYLRKYYGQLIEESKNIWETMENQREMVEVVYDSFESLTNRRLSNAMKILTIYYVIFSSLTLIAAVFGMNIGVGAPEFWLIIIGMAAVSLIMLVIFKIKKWL